ncbi:AI-2E family transporter [uncultured Planococcus sp.]|uniref:AI-2E family transporter n=1 Tax=uncultured Planococcus sp. TaxID=337815 RepID=UPI002619BA96|nr:AI-2E family transporter [uncultured Planococcus sp.]
MTHKVWFQTAVAIILTLVIIRLFIEVQGVFSPLFVVAQTIFLPLLLGGVLFYLTRPILQFLLKRSFPKWSAILLIFALIALLIWLFYILIAPIVSEQINSLMDNGPEIIERAEEYGQYLLNQREHLPDSVREQVNNLTGQFTDWAANIGSWLGSFLMGLVSGVLALVLVPFFLVYILIDHKKFAPFIAHFFSGGRKTWIRKTLHDIDETLKSYIVGQLFVSLAVGTMLLIGYLIIGLEYAFLLAVIGVVTNVIPFLGPYIAVIPAMIIALVQDPIMVVYVAIIMLVAQQIEGNLITPNIMGNALDVHPLTVITLILAAGNIAGIWGIILAVPFYAVVKTIVTNLYSKREQIEDTATKEV